MSTQLGLVAAFLALIFWGFGDFFIQRTSRQIGSMPALFYIGLLGSVIFAPWAVPHIPEILSHQWNWILLLVTVVITLVVANLEFEAFRKGKLAVVEPIMSFELLLTVCIAVIFLKEQINGSQIVLSVVIFLGIVLISLKKDHRPRWLRFWSRKKFFLEPGVLLAIAGAIVMAMTNILTGLSSQQTGPFFAIWFIHSFLALSVFVWYAVRGRLSSLLPERKSEWLSVIGEAVGDNGAWVCYAIAVTILPIGITIAITEAYIILASALGIIFNKERLQPHQIIGMVVTSIAAIILATSVG